jgi:hypothetical protein
VVSEALNVVRPESRLFGHTGGMKGIPTLIFLVFLVGAIVLENAPSESAQVSQVVRGLASDASSLESSDHDQPLGAGRVVSQNPLPTSSVRPSKRLTPSLGKLDCGVRQGFSNDQPSGELHQPNGSPRLTAVHLSELVGSSQQRAQFEAAKMLHPGLERLDPLDLYFEDVSWPY